jgi:hypothetical protein
MKEEEEKKALTLIEANRPGRSFGRWLISDLEKILPQISSQIKRPNIPCQTKQDRTDPNCNITSKSALRSPVAISRGERISA